MKGLWIVGGLLLSAGAHGNMDVTVTDIYPCDLEGNRVTPHVGDALYPVKVVWSVHHADGQTYNVQITLGNLTFEYPVWTPTDGDGYWCHLYFPGGMDGVVPISCDLDPEGVLGDPNLADNQMSSAFTPTPPGSDIVYTDKRRVFARQSTTVTFTPGSTVDRMVTWAWNPSSEANETVVSSRTKPAGTRVFSQPYNHAILRTERLNVTDETAGFEQDILADLSNVKTNAALLRSTTWLDEDTAAGSMPCYVGDEPVYQVGSPAIAQFVDTYLPSGYRLLLTPYDAAKRLYLGVNHELTYDINGGLFGADAFTAHHGDCGGYATLLVAACRHAGIPARCLCGWWEGLNQWHVMAQIYLAGHGWMTCDPTTDDLWFDPTGTYASRFGTVVDLNTFFTVNRATEHIYEGLTGDYAFQPGAIWVWGNLGIDHWNEECSMWPVLSTPGSKAAP